jgi:beta-1,4-N-acetylglucosaminyltransferase
VTVGTHIQPFDRLITAMDILAGEMDEQVLIQYGCSTYKLQHADGFAWASAQEMEKLSSEARIIVAQSAAGTIITGLKFAKPMILVPRLPQYNEVIDDHQKQLAKELSDAGKVIAIDQPDLEKLRTALQSAEHLELASNNSVQLINFLKNTLTSWDRGYKEHNVNVVRK